MVEQGISLAVSEIKGKKYQGSSIINGMTYHDIPFDEFKNIPSHRKNTIDRWNLIKSKSGIQFQQRTFIDLGCSVGAFCLLAAKEGCKKVIGIDYDNESINLARIIAGKYNLNNIEYFCNKIGPETFEKLPHFDICLWLSNWMWIVKQYGIEKAKDMLYMMSTKASAMIFESAADDAMAAIKGATQADIGKWFNECSVYSNTKDIGFIPSWHERHIFIGTNPIMTWRNAFTSSVIRINRTTVRKVFKPQFKWMVKREVEFLKLLEKYKYFPKLISSGETHIDINYCGTMISKLKPYIDQMNEILNILESLKIRHRDINKKNLLILNGNLYLIDFAWSIIGEEKDTPVPHHPSLGGIYYKDKVNWKNKEAVDVLLEKEK